MFSVMSRITKVRWIAYTAAMVLCLIGVLVSSFTGARQYEMRIDADTTRALGSTMDAVQSLDTSLRKSAYAVTPVMEDRLCMEIYGDTRQAESTLSCLPVRSDALEKIAKHIAVVGDYAAMLSRGIASGERFDAAAMKQLSRFSEQTSSLHSALEALRTKIISGDVSCESFERITDSLDNLESEMSEDVRTLSDEMASLSESFPDPDKIDYEGRYGAEDDSFKENVSETDMVTSDVARQIAGKWLDLRPELLSEAEERGGALACYCFTAKSDGREVYIAVSKAGGHVVTVSYETGAVKGAFSDQKPLDAAEGYLTAHGLADMECYEIKISGGEAILRFAPVQNGSVLCLPDTIIVIVSLSNGDVTGFQAEDYIRYHHERDLSAFASDLPDLEAAIPAGLTIRSTRPTVMQVYGEHELCCYCVECESRSGERCRIFVDASSGEQVLIQLQDELENLP